LHGGAPSENNIPLTVVLVSSTSNGSLSLSSTGAFQYVPVANFNGSDSFSYRAVDTLGGLSNVATVSITVNSVDDPPQLRLPVGGSSFSLQGGIFRAVLTPGPLPPNVTLEVTDADNPTANVAVTPPATTPFGINAPTGGASLTLPAVLNWTGACDATDPGTYTYTITITGAPSPFVVELQVIDTPPEHTIGAGFGQGTQTSPYTVIVGLGGAPSVLLSNVFDRNTSQTLAAMNLTVISPANSPFMPLYFGSANVGSLVAQASRTVTVSDVGNHDMSAEVSDGISSVTVYLRITVANTGNVPPVPGLGTGTAFSAPAANQFALSIDPGVALVDAFLLLTDSDGDLIELTTTSVTPGPLAGVTPPGSPTLGFSPLRIEWKGGIDPLMAPGDYVYSMEIRDGVNLPVAFTVTITLNNVAPSHAPGTSLVATNPGTGVAGDPYRAEIQAGSIKVMEMAVVDDANAGQFVTLTNVAGSAIGLPLFTIVLTGTGNGNEALLTATPAADLSNSDSGVYDFVATVEDDGGVATDIHIRVIVTAKPGGTTNGQGDGNGDDDGCVSDTGGGAAWMLALLASLAGIRVLRRRAA
jgi:hypothetical protein